MDKVLVIGLDGATWNILRPWIDKGKLPTFKSLIDEGVHAEFESTIPSWSIPAWNSIATGKNPGRLGYFSFMSRTYGSYTFRPKFIYARERNIWDIVGAAGKKVLVVNAPNVHVAYKINGRLVAGFLYLDEEKLTYPKTLKKELDLVSGGYIVDVLNVDTNQQSLEGSLEERFESVKSLLRSEIDEDYVYRVYDVMERRVEAFKFLLRDKWDFAFLVFVAPDRLQHRFWMKKEILLDLYRRLDLKLKEILTIIDEQTTVFILSDHGFGPKRMAFNINEWLLKEGYLKLKTKNTSKSSELVNTFTRTLSKARILPLTRRLTKSTLPTFLRSFQGVAEYLTVDNTNTDWTRTKVFTQPSDEACGDLHLNVQSREEKGIIPPEEYETIREEIVQKLTSLKDPETGRKLSPKVYKREEIYKGKYANLAPDLTILTDENIQGFTSRVGSNRIFVPQMGGEHRINGIFLAFGPNIKRGTKIDRVKVYDLAPTILHIFDLPIPQDMDGMVLKEIFSPCSSLAKRKIKNHTPVAEKTHAGRKRKHGSPQDEEEIKKRLRRLGYI